MIENAEKDEHQEVMEKVAYLYMGSTLHEYRWRGVSLALIRARLNDAWLKRCKYAFAQTLATSGNVKNIQGVGSWLIYTRPWFVKRHK